MSNRLLMLFAVTATIVATPALVKAQPIAYSSSPPVMITSLSVDALYAPQTIGGEPAEPPQFIAALNAGYLALTFVNKSNVPATTVKFLVSNGRYAQSILDKGTFSPDVRIQHTFAVGSAITALPNVTCEVSEVDFADGTAWHSVDGGAANR